MASRYVFFVFIFWGTAEMGDLVRGALTSIENIKVESAYALGLTPFQTFCVYFTSAKFKTCDTKCH